MRVKRLVLCMMLSLALVVTFIPVISFAEGEAIDEPTVEETAPAEGVDAVVEDAEEPAVEESEAAEDNVFEAKDKEDMQQGAPKAEVSAKDFDTGAKAQIVIYGGRDLVCDYDSDVFNFPKDGDKVIITFSDNETKTYVYDSGEFKNGSELLNWDYDDPFIGDTSFVFYAWDDDYTFDTTVIVPVTVIEADVKSIKFSPANITVFSEDIARDGGYGVYYTLWDRNKFIYNGSQENSAFADGDSITVTYTDGSSKVFVYKTTFSITYDDGSVWNGYDYFINGNEDLWPDTYGFSDLVPGKNNTVKIAYHGAATTINVFVDTPALRAQRAEAAAEAARQGTYNGSMPAVKASKPKAAKKAITVKWKKLKKKQFKSGVSKIEVWVSTNTAFARGATIEKTVGKKKASVKIKGLQKGVTYYAKVRTIKYVNGQKVVGKWSGVKKVKVKK